MADVQIAVIDQQNTQIAVIDQQDTQIVLAAPPETQINVAVPGTQGPAGEGVPQGGTANQVLFKQSGTDYDTAWSEITSAMIGDLEIVNADVSASAAIAGTKISPDFGSQNVVTTGTASAAAFIPSGNTAPSNGLYLPAANQVALSTNGTGRLFIDASGNVGVGVAPSPWDASGKTVDFLAGAAFSINSGAAGEFDLAYNLYFDGTNWKYKAAGPASASMYSLQAGIHKWFTVGDGTAGSNATLSERLRITSTGELKHLGGQAVGSPAVYFAGSAPSNSLVIDSSGRLLIGTASHSGTPCQLEVASSTGSIVNLRNTDTSIINNDIIGRINFVGDDPAIGKVGARITAQSEGTWADINYLTKLFFETAGAGDSSPQVRMTIKSDGKVGVGTTDPQNLLSLGLGSGTTTRILGQYGNNVSTTLEVGAGQASTFRGGMRIAVTDTFAGSVGDSVVSFHTTKDGGGTVQRLTIDEDGNVGIGNQAPNYALDVTGSINAYNGFLRIAGTSSPSGNDPHIYRPGSSEMGFWAGGDERMRIDSSGNLLVGTTSSTSVGSSVGAKIQTRFSSSNVGISVVRENNTPIIALGRANGVVAQIVSDNQALGEIRFAGADGTDLESIAASITCEVDGTPGANDMPGRLVFSTNPGSPATGPTTRMELKADGRLYVQGVYDFTASASTVVVQPNGLIARSSSSIKYKTNVETIQDQYSDAILNVRPVWYQSLSELDNPDWGWWGFIAEEVAEIDPRLVHWKTVESVVQEDGSRVETPCDPAPEDVAYDRFVPHLLNLIKRQQQAIETLEAKVAALESA